MATKLNLPVYVLLAFCIIAGNQQVWAVTPSPTQSMPATNAAGFEQQLAECVTIAKSGDVKTAIRQAMTIKTTFGNQRFADISFINTVVSIAEETDSSFEAKILNEAIVLVNTIRQDSKYQGINDPEGAYFLMGAIGRLAKVTTPLSERVTSKLKIMEGSIALQLKNNPAFPINAHEALGRPLVSMAQGYAIRNKSEQAVTALQNAVDVGFGEIDSLNSDDLIARAINEVQREKLVASLKVRYKTAMKKWSQTVLAQFQPFYFDYDVNDIQGGRVSKQDFLGKVVVVDIWATWCGPCMKAIPHYIELQKTYGDRGVAVLGIAMDNPDDPASALDTVREFAAEKGFNYRCGMGTQSVKNMIPGKYALPSTIFMDRNGMVRYIARGYHDYTKIEALTQILANESEPVRNEMFLGN
jgi:thiol-disulfide isomerase/thioredoxin